MGGSDDSSNLIELTPEEHAEAHKILFEQHGHWQDYVAWQGLAKLSEKADLIKVILSESGKKGNANRSSTNKGKKYNTSKIKKEGIRSGNKNPCARDYEITCPNGNVIHVKSLKTWCEDKQLKYNTIFNVCVGRGRTHQGYMVKKV